MSKQLAAAGLCWMIAGYAAGAEVTVPGAPPDRDPASMQVDAMNLCGRLAGTERDVCMSQAQENRRMADPAALGATPGMPGGGTAERRLPAPDGPNRVR